jgi:nitrilase
MIPVFDQETILHACLDLTETEREYMTLDVSGHYSRPDLFRFSVAEERRE